jgi:hypothetical protein
VDTIVEVPAAFKAASLRCALLFDLAESARRAASAGEPFLYADLERAFACGVGQLQRDLHAVVLAAMACEQPRLMIHGVPHRRVLRAATTYHSLAGDVVVDRWLYRSLLDPQAPAVDPVALRVGAFAATWLPATATAMAFLVQQAPVREAVQTARALGVLPYSAASFHRVTQAVGEAYEAHQDAVEDALIERYEVPAKATGITLSLDRVAGPFEMPRARGRGRPRKKAPRRPIARVWKMIYCASLTLHDANGRALETLRYGCMPDDDPKAVTAAMLSDVEALRRRRPDLLVGVICDGAREMWNLLDGAVAQAGLEGSVRRLVDLWHLLGYAGKALRVRYDERHASKELERWKLRLLNQSGAARRLLDELRGWDAALRTRRVGDEQPVQEALTYLSNQLDAGRVDYAAARRAGQPVGSGNVEATCKSLVGVRFKRAGSRWKQRSGGHVLRLRAVALSRRWDAATELLHSKRIHEIKMVG